MTRRRALLAGLASVSALPHVAFSAPDPDQVLLDRVIARSGGGDKTYFDLTLTRFQARASR